MGVNSNGSRISFVAHACRLTLTSGISETCQQTFGIFSVSVRRIVCSYLE
jgi:hypothetical protein